MSLSQDELFCFLDSPLWMDDSFSMDLRALVDPSGTEPPPLSPTSTSSACLLSYLHGDAATDVVRDNQCDLSSYFPNHSNESIQTL